MENLELIVTLATDIAALIVMLLITVAFREHVFRYPVTASDYIGLGIFIMTAGKILRLIWWDIFPIGLGFRWSDFGIYSDHVNWFFNVIFTIGGIVTFKGVHLVIPERHRHKYNLFTAPFYPGAPCKSIMVFAKRIRRK